jgi:hypothetical protein
MGALRIKNGSIRAHRLECRRLQRLPPHGFGDIEFWPYSLKVNRQCGKKRWRKAATFQEQTALHLKFIYRCEDTQPEAVHDLAFRLFTAIQVLSIPIGLGHKVNKRHCRGNSQPSMPGL